MTPGALLVATLAAFPLPRDAGPEEYADPANWPNDPGWTDEWPLLSFVPPGFEQLVEDERDAGVGMHVDRAWSVTLGDPSTVIAVITAPDAGSPPLGWVNAPVDDLDAGVGACPRCSVLLRAATIDALPGALNDVVDAGARTVVLLVDAALAPRAVTDALDAHAARALFIAPGTGTPVTRALELHPAVLVPRTLTATATKTSARARNGCGGRTAVGRVSVPSTSCATEAALRLAGVSGLVWSIAPGLHPRQVLGLLGGPRVDALAAVLAAEGVITAPPAPIPPLRPSLVTPASIAERCELWQGDLRTTIACGTPAALTPTPLLPLDQDPLGAVVDFVERRGGLEWSTPLLAPPAASVRNLIGLTWFEATASAPRFVDLDGQGDEAVVATRDGALMGFTGQLEPIAPLTDGAPLAPAFGDVFDDRRLDVVSLTTTGRLDVVAIGGTRAAGFPLELGGAPAGPAVVASASSGTIIVTALASGRVEQRRTASVDWSVELGAPLLGPVAVGDLDGDGVLDVAGVAGGNLHAVFIGGGGRRPESWARPTAGSTVLLANLGGDAALELVVDQVFDATGERVLSLEGWTAPVSQPALGRLTAGALRSLVQLEALPLPGQFALVRYDVEAALRRGDPVALRSELAVLRHRPAPGGVAIADVTGDGLAEVMVATEDGLVFLVDGSGQQAEESPLPALGSVFSAPAVGVARSRLELALMTVRGDLVRWRVRGFPSEISWEGEGHDRGHTLNAETPLPRRELPGLGITEPPVIPGPGCAGCSAGGPAALVVLLLFWGRRKPASRPACHGPNSPAR